MSWRINGLTARSRDLRGAHSPLAKRGDLGENDVPPRVSRPLALYMKGKIYSFAEFELWPAESELRKGDTSIKLQEKPLRLLTALLDHPQNLVTRDQLRRQMWDSETFVDYEQGINVAVKKVRDALGDSAENPRLIETVAKRGYRMLAPVDVVAPEGEPSPARWTPAQPTAAEPPAPRQPARMRWGWVALAATVPMVNALGSRRDDAIFQSPGTAREHGSA